MQSIKAEKNIMYAQTFNTGYMLSPMICVTFEFFISDLKKLVEVFVMYTLPNNRLQPIPRIIVVSTVIQKNIIPSFLLEYRDTPTIFIKKEGLGLLQRQSTRSASFLQILPLLSNVIVIFAPTGKPHSIPTTIGYKDKPDMPKIILHGFCIALLNKLPKLPEIINSEMMKKGNNDGMIVLVQRSMLDLTESKTTFELEMKIINNNKQSMTKRICPSKYLLVAVIIVNPPT